MTEAVAPHTPVLVGVGAAMRREEDPSAALEPLDLMLEAVAKAGRDAGDEAWLSELDAIAVPRGRWSYRDPAGALARAVGATRARTIVASVGVLQQSLIADACKRIADGEASMTLVVGGDAGYRLLRAGVTGVEAPERAADGEPDVRLEPATELRHPAEIAAGMKMPVGLYAILESAHRAAHGLTVDGHRDRLAALGERFSRVAADNPQAWDRRAHTAADIRDASPRNPMQAFPYTRSHCSTWNVDQAAALLFCSAGRAEALGVDRSRWIFPLASAESNHMIAVSARDDLATCPGALAAGRAVLQAAGLDLAQIDLIELYSCFPIAVQTYAEALGLPLDGPLTVTGGMPFAGGPFNNYVFQATARAAERLRGGDGRTALISSVSGILTKQAFAAWSTTPPREGFHRIDVSRTVADASRERPVHERFTGEGVVVGCTVLHGRGKVPRAVALVDTPDGGRALATSEREDLIDRFQREEWVGRTVRIADNGLTA